MHLLTNKQELFHSIAQGAAVITPNNRLSDALLDQYFIHSNQPTVDKPVCLPYRAVIHRAYEHLKWKTPHTQHPGIINSAQCQHLWRAIIKKEDSVTFCEGLLNAVIQAWEQCAQWDIDPEDSSFHYTHQTQQFQNWWKLFNQQVHQQQLMSEYQLIPYLLKSNEMVFAPTLIWACFDEFTPQQKRLQEHLAQHGVMHYAFDLPFRPTQPQVYAAPNEKEEYQQLIAWVEQKIGQGQQRIGIVVPELQQKAPRLRRMLADHFDGQLFNISLGQSLSDFPMIAHALTWLKLKPQELQHHEATLLLQSPYLAHAHQEFNERSQYVQEGTLLQNQTFNVQQFIHDIQALTPQLAERLAAIKPYPKQATPDQWVHHLQHRLNQLGFPGELGLNSEQYQCFNRFNQIFDELRSFQRIETVLTQDQVLELFTHLTQNTIFQAQKTNAKIHISGLLEASGCEFDSLWVTGLSDQCLPQKTRLSAFIPHTLQRTLSMPHSTPERELLFAQQTLNRLYYGSEEIVLSFPELNGDSPNLPCALINHFPAYAEVAIAAEQPIDLPLELSEDNYQLPLKATEQRTGSTSLLANQAKCPFKAFAEHRLYAKKSHAVLDGLNPMDRGNLIHKVMELLWLELGSQETLLQLSRSDLEQQIDKAIQKALRPLQQVYTECFSEVIQDIEHNRLKRVVLACLDWEKQRDSFTVVALEQSYSITLSGMEFKVRVDRLDQVDDKKWVIDYKSSLPSTKPWNEERPREPQLLLYALLDEHINTLMFLQMKSGNVLCSGISELDQQLHGISALKKDQRWEDYTANWQQQLEMLADEYQRGLCPPQPTHLSLCQQCDFNNLCRFQAVE